jgi:hypothetical protein
MATRNKRHLNKREIITKISLNIFSFQYVHLTHIQRFEGSWLRSVVYVWCVRWIYGKCKSSKIFLWCVKCSIAKKLYITKIKITFIENRKRHVTSNLQCIYSLGHEFLIYNYYYCKYDYSNYRKQWATAIPKLTTSRLSARAETSRSLFKENIISNATQILYTSPPSFRHNYVHTYKAIE